VSTAADAQYYRHHHRYHHNRQYSEGGPAYQGTSYSQPDCRPRSGTTGLIAGGVGGALLGNVISHGTTGTLIGAGAGALLGRQVERHGLGDRC
jgi:hypothetical protein